jgi:hypothetical protein
MLRVRFRFKDLGFGVEDVGCQVSYFEIMVIMGIFRSRLIGARHGDWGVVEREVGGVGCRV